MVKNKLLMVNDLKIVAMMMRPLLLLNDQQQKKP